MTDRSEIAARLDDLRREIGTRVVMYQPGRRAPAEMSAGQLLAAYRDAAEERIAELETIAQGLDHNLDLASARIAELEASRDAWRKAAQEMVPGGSEFTTPDACLRYNREQRTNLQESTVRAHGKANAAERRVAELEAKVAELGRDTVNYVKTAQQLFRALAQLKAAEAKVTEMERDRRIYHETQWAQLKAAEAKVAGLEQALRPFADIALARDFDPAGEDRIEAADMAINPRNVRDARAALTPGASADEGEA